MLTALPAQELPWQRLGLQEIIAFECPSGDTGASRWGTGSQSLAHAGARVSSMGRDCKEGLASLQAAIQRFRGAV